jgi:hypothetical protein
MQQSDPCGMALGPGPLTELRRSGGASVVLHNTDIESTFLYLVCAALLLTISLRPDWPRYKPLRAVSMCLLAQGQPFQMSCRTCAWPLQISKTRFSPIVYPRIYPFPPTNSSPSQIKLSRFGCTPRSRRVRCNTLSWQSSPMITILGCAFGVSPQRRGAGSRHGPEESGRSELSR